jgi:DNA-directed RNA polymerase subunit E'/Rpb7
MTESLQQPGLYQNQIISQSIHVPFQNLYNDLNEIFMNYMQKNVMNRCAKEGYISNRNCKVITYSAGRTVSSMVEFKVQFEVDVCYPYENMKLQCYIQSITKIGIKAILSNDETENPIVVFASYLHNPSIFERNMNSEYKVGDQIQVRVLGHRFEINDPSIYVLAEII